MLSLALCPCHQDDVVDEMVPEAHRYLAMAMRCDHPIAKAMWGPNNEAAVLQDMRLEATSALHGRMVMNKLRAETTLVQDYLAGRLDRNVVAALGDVVSAPSPQRQQHRLPIQYRYAAMVADGRKTVEGRINIGIPSKVKEGDILLLGTARVVVTQILSFRTFADMLEAVGVERALPDTGSIAEAVDVYHAFRNYEELAAKHGVRAFFLGPVPPTAAAPRTQRPAQPHPLQLRFETLLHEDIARTVQVHDAKTEADSDEARAQCYADNKIRVCEGPPGSGKTTFVHLCIEAVLQIGGRVLFALPTAQLASRMREKYGGSVDIDTFHAAMGYGEEFSQVCFCLAPYILVVVDEMSQLDAAQFRHLNQLWQAVDNVPTIAMLGDRHQMRGFGDERPWDCPQWHKATHTTALKQAFRCQDPGYARLLGGIRTTRPQATPGKTGAVTVADLMRNRRAWRGGQPTVADIRRILIQHPNTTLLAVTRAGAALLNDLAMQAKFPKRTAVATINGDVESNPANYIAGKLKAAEDLVPTVVHLHIGMRVYLTRNVQKNIDYVNGMLAVVEAWDAAANAVRVGTATGHRVTIWPWTDEKLGGAAYYPLRPGYASTILKFQGTELSALQAQ